MYTMNMLAVGGALLSAVAAIPMANKRDIEWVTATDVEYVTVPYTTTVWVDEAATTSSHYGHHHNSKTQHIQSTVTVAAEPSSPSAYVAPSSPEAPPAPAATSVYVAPTTSQYVAPPAPTPTYVAPTTSAYVASSARASTQPAAPAYQPQSSGSGVSSGPAASGKSYTGDLTWYQDGMGSCGWTNGPSDHIVAISHTIFDEYTPNGNPNNNPLCGKTVTIKGKNGSSYTGKVVDRCVGCAPADLDLSEDFFNTVTDNGNGRVPNMSWKWD